MINTRTFRQTNAQKRLTNIQEYLKKNEKQGTALNETYKQKKKSNQNHHLLNEHPSMCFTIHLQTMYIELCALDPVDPYLYESISSSHSIFTT